MPPTFIHVPNKSNHSENKLTLNKFSLQKSLNYGTIYYVDEIGRLNSLIIDNNKQIQPEGLSNRFYNALANIQNK
jgi:hypothetical protein